MTFSSKLRSARIRKIYFFICAFGLVVVCYFYFRLVANSETKGIRSSSLGNESPLYLDQNETVLAHNRKTFISSNINGRSSVIEWPLFPDKQFISILDTFRNPEAYRRKTSFRSGASPTVYIVSSQSLSSAFWTESLLQFSDNLCPLKCTFIDDKEAIDSADAVLVFMNFFNSVQSLKSKLPVRDPLQPWIVMSVESPVHMILKNILPLTAFNGTFNRTMTYRMDSDVVVSHGFIIPKEDAKILPPSWVLTSQEEEAPFDTRKLVIGFISHCPTRGGRMKYINDLKKHVQVDVYGACGSLKCGSSRFVAKGVDVQNDECLAIARNYLFYLSFENSIALDYVTEKLYNILFYPVVPIVFGGANYSNILLPNSYISAMDYTPKELANIIINLSRNETKYQEMLSWRQYYKVSTVGQRRIYCDLCTKLHQPEFFEHKVYDDLYDWFFVKSHCKGYTQNGIVPIE